MVQPISVIKFLVVKLPVSYYYFYVVLQATGRLFFEYSNDLQATGTTHNNEKNSWYWIGTKSV